MLNYLHPKRLIKQEPVIRRKFRIHWKETDYESLKIIHSGATERINDTIKDQREISKKYFGFLILILSITSALVAFLFDEQNISYNIRLITILTLISNSLIIFIIGQMIRPLKFYPPGRVPNEALNEPFIEKNTEDQQKYFLYKELLNLEAKILINQFYNTKRLDGIDFIIRYLLISSTCFIILILLTSLI
ncbi:MAG: hypothetical protein ACJAUV_001730 [Flavobacteriales bacterium]|jgi:hypothetical protein